MSELSEASLTHLGAALESGRFAPLLVGRTGFSDPTAGEKEGAMRYAGFVLALLTLLVELANAMHHW